MSREIFKLTDEAAIRNEAQEPIIQNRGTIKNVVRIVYHYILSDTSAASYAVMHEKATCS